LNFAVKLTRLRGHVTDADFAAVRAAGYKDAQIIEIVQNVALNTWKRRPILPISHRHALPRSRGYSLQQFIAASTASS
jgi:alkylhydroperoxidase family enzyme